MLPQQQMQLLHLQRFTQNAAVVAVIVYMVLRMRWWRQYRLKPWIARRPQCGDFENLTVGLETERRGYFVGYLRVEPAMFHELLQRLTPRLTKQATNYRKPLCPGIKIAVTLRFLATGNSYPRGLVSGIQLHNIFICLQGL